MRLRSFDANTDLQEVTQLFMTCFAEPPWFERFDFDQTAEWFLRFLEDPTLIFLVVEQEDDILGVGIAHALTARTDIIEILPDADLQRTLYMAELFVHPEHRSKKIGHWLTMERFRLGREKGFTIAVARTSVQQVIIQDLYHTRGFETVATQQVISTKFIGGEEQQVPDTRVIMVGDIPAEAVLRASA